MYFVTSVRFVGWWLRCRLSNREASTDGQDPPACAIRAFKHPCGNIEQCSTRYKVSTTSRFGTPNGVLHCSMSPPIFFISPNGTRRGSPGHLWVLCICIQSAAAALCLLLHCGCCCSRSAAASCWCSASCVGWSTLVLVRGIWSQCFLYLLQARLIFHVPCANTIHGVELPTSAVIRPFAEPRRASARGSDAHLVYIPCLHLEHKTLYRP